ncbi:MAG: ABC transporter ATP-binding protein [Sphingomicrobium sp.]
MTSALHASGIRLHGRLAVTDLTIATGEMVALVGSNGSGKTSLLRALAGIEDIKGTVSASGEPVATLAIGRRSRILTFLPASRDLIWPVAARDLIALGLPVADSARVEAMIALFELEALATRPVDRLSTGERTRVLLARALAPVPRLLLLDEPLSNLDPYWVLRTLEIIRAAVTAGAAALVALHDIDRLPAFDRVLLMDNGGILADGSPAELLESEQFGAAFGILRYGESWKLRPPADRQSSL